MKAKLLKKLRKIFYIEYTPSSSFQNYIVHLSDSTRYCGSYNEAKRMRDDCMLSYGHDYYRKYLKKIKIK